MFRNVVWPILGAVMACLAATCHEGCKPVDGPSVGDLYTMEQQACVAKSRTREESQACRDKVDCKYEVCKNFPELCRPGQCQ